MMERLSLSIKPTCSCCERVCVLVVLYTSATVLVRSWDGVSVCWFGSMEECVCVCVCVGRQSSPVDTTMQFCTRNLALHLVKQLSSRVLELHQNQAAPRSN